MVSTLAVDWSSVGVGAAVVGFLFICILLILTVLIQRPQGGGLAGAFGSSAGSGQTAFGAKTGDALTIFTIAMFVVYLLVAVGLNYVVKPGAGPAKTDDKASQTSNPAPAGAGETLVPMQVSTPTPTPAPASQAPPVSPEGASPSNPSTAPATNPEQTPADPKPEDPKPVPPG